MSPMIRVDIDHPPFAGTAGGSAGPATVAMALAPLSRLSLSNGRLRVVSAKRDVDTLIDNVHGRFDGLTVGDRLRFNVSAVWRNTPVTVVGALGDPETAAKGETSPLSFALDSPLAKLVFGGAFAFGDKPSAEGDLIASIPSIAALASFLDAPPPPVAAANDIAITGKIKAARNTLRLDDATLTSAGQKLEGALAIDDVGGRPAVSGTLAAGTLALSPLLGSPQRFFGSSGWSAKPFALAPLSAFDLDLRLSAAHLDVYGLALADAAVSASVNDGKLSMSVIDAQAYGGRFEGEVDAACAGRDLKISASGELADADLGAAIADFGRPVATGRGGARFDIEASGASPAAEIASLSGAASLKAADGAILGVNLEEALRRSRRRSIDVGRDMRLGGTAFDQLDVSLLLDNGRARVERGAMTSHGVTADLNGLIDLVGWRWALRLDAVQTNEAGEESPDAARLTLDIAGPWSAPKVRAIGANGQTGPVGDPRPSR